MISGVKSGSILLFHNDLKNTTEALPDILTQLRDKGYEFVTVSDLIFWEDYTIDANGVQVPISKSSLDISAENVDEVMSQYVDEIIAAGFTDEQIAQAAEAIKAGGELPAEVLEVMARIGLSADEAVPINTGVHTNTSDTTK